MTDAPRSFPRIKPRTLYSARACNLGGGRPHWHVTLEGRDIVADNGRFTFADRVGAETEAIRMNHWVRMGDA